MRALDWPHWAAVLVVVYLLLLSGLAFGRWATRHTLPNLQSLQDQEAALRYRQSEFTLDIQRLESAARVRVWAAQNGFIPYSTARREFADLPPLPMLPTLKTPERQLKVTTQWR